MSHELHRIILENLDEGICAFNLDRRITYWNSGAESITGFSLAEVLSRKCSDNILMHLDDSGVGLCGGGCLLGLALSGKELQDAELFIRHKKGHRVPVRVRSRPLRDAAGIVVGAIQVFTENSRSVAALERITELERISYIDALTELANRRYTEIILQTRIDEMQRYGWPFGVILIDMDNLKEINDTHGHDAGDDMLRAVARSLRLGSRPFDLKGRWGGDEFIAIVANVEIDGLWLTANRLRALVEQSMIEVGTQIVRTTVSVGAAVARPGESPRDLMRRVDGLLYESKRGGRNRTSIEGGVSKGH